MTIRRAVFAILISGCVGFALSRWYSRKPDVDLGKASSRYISSGFLSFKDSNDVEIATVQFELPHSPTQVNLYNGLRGLGWFSLDPPYLQLDNGKVGPQRGHLTFSLDASGGFHLSSQSPTAPKEMGVSLQPPHHAAWGSKEWLLNLAFSTNRVQTLAEILPSEDLRLVRRNGTLFAVCGYDKLGKPSVVFVSPKGAPLARLFFRSIDPDETDDSSRGAIGYDMFDQSGYEVANIETDLPQGPVPSFANGSAHSGMGMNLDGLDPTGTRLIGFGPATAGNPDNPGFGTGIVDWMVQPMYHPKFPIRFFDATGRIIWTAQVRTGR